MSKSDKKKAGSNTIALNKKARHDYFIESTFEAGISLLGWEVKALREKKAQITDTYVHIRNGEAFLVAAQISPLKTASTHITPEPMRTRKLLLHRYELDKLVGAVERKGYTVVPLAMYWKGGKAKLEIGLAKGKASHDKRATEKERDWQREKQRIMRHSR